MDSQRGEPEGTGSSPGEEGPSLVPTTDRTLSPAPSTHTLVEEMAAWTAD